ncbi:MAG: hypothetical protein HRU41_35660 [Saprospiraceae bacterium]|nr:hypothetical protein [Saprospiraceae bacterium]
MKRINIFLVFAFVLALTACEKDRAFIEFKDLEYGAFPRLIDGVNGEFNFFDPSGSAIDFTVEFYDENQGKNVQSYSWTVSYFDKTAGTFTTPQTIGTFTASDFKPEPETGLPSITIQFTFQQALDAMGLTTSDIKGGDAVRFNGTITKTDGKTFDVSNTGANIIGNAPAFGALFAFDQNIICPSSLEGTYTTTTTGNSTDSCCPDETTVTGEVTLTAEGSGKYTISDWSAGLYLEWFDVYGITPTTDLTAELIDACGNISLPDFGEPFGEQVSGTGSLDAATGVITYTWTSGWGDVATVTMTPK